LIGHYPEWIERERLMDRKPPKRLTLEQFMLPSAPFRIIDQTVKQKVEPHWYEFTSSP
jgi:hypothetical protein